MGILIFLIALAILLLYVSASVLTGTGKVLDTAYEKAHTADFVFMTDMDKTKELEDIFENRKEVAEYEVSECLWSSNAKYRRDKSEDSKEFTFLLNRMDEDRTISVLEKTESSHYNDIILPYYLFAAEKYQVGDSFFLTLGEKEYEFRVAGYGEDPLFATPLNISTYSVYITSAYMEDMLEKDTDLQENMGFRQYRMRLKEGESLAEFDENIMKELTEKIPEIANTDNMGINYETMKIGDSVMPNISMGIILVFSILLVLVALIIIRFTIRNFLEMNLKNVGVLEASGYTVKQLKLASILEMDMVAAVGILAGAVLGVLGSRIIGELQGRQMGIFWNQGIDPFVLLSTVVGSFVVITGAAGFASRIYGKVSVLDALRGGIHTHNFRRNYFPFENSRLPRSLVLAGKYIFGEKVKNVSILCIISLLSFATCVSFALYQNFAQNTDYLLKLVGLEVSDIVLLGDIQTLEDIGEEMAQWQETEKVLYYDNGSVQLSKGEKTRTINCDIWKNPKLNEYEMLLEGRLPKYDNEIVLTKASADAIEADVGDVIYVEAREGKKDYIITGIDQKMNHTGLNCMITMEGAKRLNGQTRVFELFVYVKDGISFEDIRDKVKREYPELLIQDPKQISGEVVSSVISGIVLICVIFVLVTVFVVAMVVVLLVRSKVIRERKNYGISKALGYTTGQLIVETMMMNMPVIVAGAVLGATASIFLADSLVEVFLSSMGIEQCNLTVSVEGLLSAITGIVVVAVGISFLSSVRIRKIEPVKMLTEE